MRCSARATPGWSSLRRSIPSSDLSSTRLLRSRAARERVSVARQVDCPCCRAWACPLVCCAHRRGLGPGPVLVGCSDACSPCCCSPWPCRPLHLPTPRRSPLTRSIVRGVGAATSRRPSSVRHMSVAAPGGIPIAGVAVEAAWIRQMVHRYTVHAVWEPLRWSNLPCAIGSGATATAYTGLYCDSLAP